MNLKSSSINLTKTTFYQEYPKEKMQPMIDAVNSYNSTPFIINQKVLEVKGSSSRFNIFQKYW